MKFITHYMQFNPYCVSTQVSWLEAILVLGTQNPNQN